MSVNNNNPSQWKSDIAKSVDLYNSWFMEFAPKAFRETRITTAKQVQNALKYTNNLSDLSPELLKEHPEVLPILRMSTCPPVARDRLVGLSGISKNLVISMEDKDSPRMPQRMPQEKLDADLMKICEIIRKMADPDIFVWLGRSSNPTEQEISRAATIVADRLCGAVTDPIIRNAQEKRQLSLIAEWLKVKGYHEVKNPKFDKMAAGTFSFRTNIPIVRDGFDEQVKVNIPIDVMIMPFSASSDEMPTLIEAKSAGDFTNVNKRRKEEAQKMSQLRYTYGSKIRLVLFLCGYFDSGYLGYEAAEGIDWIWEHRIDDMQLFGI